MREIKEYYRYGRYYHEEYQMCKYETPASELAVKLSKGERLSPYDKARAIAYADQRRKQKQSNKK